MSTIRSQIIDRIVDRLNGVGVRADILAKKPAEFTARRFGPQTIDFPSNPAQRIGNVSPVKEKATGLGSRNSNKVDRELHVRMDFYAARTSEDPDADLDDLLDPMINWATVVIQYNGSTLSLNEDPSTAIVKTINDDEIHWEIQESPNAVAHATCLILVSYSTQKVTQELIS